MIRGQIIKGVAGNYEIVIEEKVYMCKARGRFRNEKILPLVGDFVNVDLNSDGTGVIKEILERSNFLVRPAVANVEQVILTFSMTDPDINYILLDKFLVMVESKGLEIIICINKVDIADKENIKRLKDVYTLAGYDVLFVSVKESIGIEKLRDVMKNKVNVFAGPSGVGKSSILNKLQDGLMLQTGDLSQKTMRGKHTTRAVELIKLDFGGYVLDTPGFTALEIIEIKPENLGFYFNEIKEYSNICKFRDCIHMTEPGCAVKEALGEGKIAKERYERYLSIYNELRNNTRGNK